MWKWFWRLNSPLLQTCLYVGACLVVSVLTLWVSVGCASTDEYIHVQPGLHEPSAEYRTIMQHLKSRNER